MPKPKQTNQRQPLYMAQRPDYEALKRQNQEYAHPRILVGHRYGDKGPDYFHHEFGRPVPTPEDHQYAAIPFWSYFLD